MITRLDLHNFQSHKNTTLEFHNGVNAIVGESDNGKTAILRALYWARYNQPAGGAYISKWARDETGKQIENTSVVVYKGKKKLTRGKGKLLNGYDIDGKIFEALGKGGLPGEVITFFNTTDVNIQEQMDRPFLIGSTPSEISKFLNTIVDMTEIDNYLSAAERKKRNNNKDIKRVTKEATELKEELTAFTSLDDIKALLNKLEKVQNRKTTKNNDRRAITNLLSTHTSLQEEVTVWRDVVKIEALLKKVTPIYTKKGKVEKKVRLLNKEIKGYYVIQDLLKDATDIDTIETLLKKVKVVNKKRIEKEKEGALLTGLLESYNTNTKIIEKNTKKIGALKKELPKICPTCGQPWREK